MAQRITMQMVAAAIAIVITARIVGVLLVSSLLILPAAAALQFSRGFLDTLLWAIGFGMTSILLGLHIATNHNLSSGAAVSAASLALLLGAMFVKKQKETIPAKKNE